MTTSTECAGARSAILSRDFSAWAGLPADCSASDLFGPQPADLQGLPRRFLGDDFEQGTFVLLDIPGYYRPMATFKDGHLVLFDGMPAEPILLVAELKTALGEPAAELDWDFGTLHVPGGEQPFPDRGITLFVNTDADRLLHIALYHETTLDAYVRGLRPHLRKEVHPLPTGGGPC